jgi:hypothetical protein
MLWQIRHNTDESSLGAQLLRALGRLTVMMHGLLQPHLGDLVSCYDVVKQVKQLTMLLRLHVKVPPV